MLALKVLLWSYLSGIIYNWLMTSFALIIISLAEAKKAGVIVFVPSLVLDLLTYRVIKNPEFMGRILGSWSRARYITRECINAIKKVREDK